MNRSEFWEILIKKMVFMLLFYKKLGTLERFRDINKSIQHSIDPRGKNKVIQFFVKNK